MRKIISVFIAFIIMILPIGVFASAEKTYSFTVGKEDLSGNNFQIFLINCSGHYSAENDSVSLYVTNTSSAKATFQLHVGYSGSADKPTSIDGAPREIAPGKSVEFIVTGLKKALEKANDELGYVPGKTLSANSVVRISAVGLGEGDTFEVTGISIGAARNTYYKETNNYKETTYNKAITSSAEIVDQSSVTPTPEVFGYTMTQPSMEFVNGFITFIGVSAVLCIGGIAIYTVSAIIKRRKSND